jgi:hypothetical protein
MSITISISTSSYNSRRFGKPWIAKVDFDNDPQGEFVWGVWIGQPGEAGELTLANLKPGDVVAQGQKDFRKPKNSMPEWGYIDTDGQLVSCDSKIEAIKAAREIRAAADANNGNGRA